VSEQKNNAYLSSSDPIVIVVYDETETVELFGKDMLLEDGVCIPESLLERYKQNRLEFKAIQAELAVIKKERDSRW
jgi:hypothetical protein